MAHFAELDENNIVIRVIKIDNDMILDSLGVEQEQLGSDLCIRTAGGGAWVQTSYNSTIRKKYAGIGDTYDTTRDAFITPQPYPSWVLDEDTCEWDSPVPYPIFIEDSTEYYSWDEETVQWIREDEPTGGQQ